MYSYAILTDAKGKIVAVKQGWSWPAFCFTFIWLLVKEIWGVACIIFAIWIVLYVACNIMVGSWFSNEAMTAYSRWGLLLGSIIRIIGGIRGNQWRVQDLNNRGYQLQTRIEARNPEDAVKLYTRDASPVTISPTDDQVVSTPNGNHCPSCGLAFDLSDYRPNVDHIYCSGCKKELPRH